MKSFEVDAAQHVRIGAVTSLRRMAVLFLLSIPAAGATVWDEILLAGPIVFLVEVLGFALGLVLFILIWAALGIGAMATIDFVWPRVARALDPLMKRSASRSADGERAEKSGWLPVVAISVASAILLAALLAVLLIASGIRDWIADHQVDLGMFLATAIVIFAILVVVDRLTRGLENWVRSIAGTGGSTLRSMGALVTMVVLGPVLGWPLFRLLGYSRRSTYSLTLAAAPIFGGIWVPFYGLGVWGLIEGWL
jgi:hypothetical protein